MCSLSTGSPVPNTSSRPQSGALIPLLPYIESLIADSLYNPTDIFQDHLSFLLLESEGKPKF